jgi:Protein of unknown function (DUF3606)
MADNPNIRGAEDRQRINVEQDYELRRWSQKFGVSEDEVRRAVREVGPLADDVEKHLRGHKARGHPV